MPEDESGRYALLVAASFIAAIRTLKRRIVENDWDTDKSVDESMRLARMIRKRIEQEP